MAGPWEKYSNPQPQESGPWAKYEPATEVSGAAERSAPIASMGANQMSPTSWLGDVENDLREGGSRTIVGRGLGHLQGRGEKGYSGLQSGVSPETAEMMGSVPLGVTRAVKGMSEIGSGHPLTGGGDVIAGGLQAATIPASFVAPEAAGTGNEIRSVLHIPNAPHAARMINEVEQAAKNIPVTMAETQPAVDAFGNYVRTGGRGTPVINKLRAGMAQGPMNFPEARDFYTNVSRASARPGFLRRAIESPAMPDLRRNVGNVRQAMSEDLTSALVPHGLSDKYTDAMREYARAAQLNKGLKMAGAVAAEEALRHSGLLGKMAAGAANIAGR